MATGTPFLQSAEHGGASRLDAALEQKDFRPNRFTHYYNVTTSTSTSTSLVFFFGQRTRRALIHPARFQKNSSRGCTCGASTKCDPGCHPSNLSGSRSLIHPATDMQVIQNVSFINFHPARLQSNSSGDFRCGASTDAHKTNSDICVLHTSSIPM